MFILMGGKKIDRTMVKIFYLFLAVVTVFLFSWFISAIKLEEDVILSDEADSEEFVNDSLPIGFVEADLFYKLKNDLEKIIGQVPLHSDIGHLLNQEDVFKHLKPYLMKLSEKQRTTFKQEVQQILEKARVLLS
ncbi:uncharacterized protein LOC114327127 [Diabrotica virgifera virgifera]|uniref:Uncharacterized protein LOC114327127 n=1 Tax=Diabrotica virgifera virgifera TaxID=50390 RepID=A0A6P7F9I5_DIAVI|nr:uncharacterized protein LOC114327127 [Diabrotica virgifera virgifera]